MPGSVIEAPSTCVLTPLPTTVPEWGIHLHVTEKGHDLSTVILGVLERDLTLGLPPPAGDGDSDGCGDGDGDGDVDVNVEEMVVVMVMVMEMLMLR